MLMLRLHRMPLLPRWAENSKLHLPEALPLTTGAETLDLERNTAFNVAKVMSVKKASGVLLVLSTPPSMWPEATGCSLLSWLATSLRTQEVGQPVQVSGTKQTHPTRTNLRSRLA